jgi:hypothetical protein
MASNAPKGRHNPRVSQVHIDETRARIKAHGLITRLQTFALGELVTQVGEDGTIRQMIRTEDGEMKQAMTRDQVAAACKLLSYVLPTLQSVEVNTQETKTYVLRAPAPSKNVEEWLADFGPKTIEGTKQ